MNHARLAVSLACASLLPWAGGRVGADEPTGTGRSGRSESEVAGERALDEAARWIAKGEAPPSRLETLHADLDYAFDDGSFRREGHMNLWFRNPDAYRADTQYAGRDATLLLVGEQGWLVRERIKQTHLNTSPLMKELLPQMRDDRERLREVGRLMTPAGLKGPGVTFTLLGHERNPAATGGAWYRVVRRSPSDPDMTFFFGTAPTKEGTGTRAIAPDKVVIAGDARTNYPGDEYRLQDWLHTDAGARLETFRFPRRIRMYVIGVDREEKPTFRASLNLLEINVAIPPGTFELEGR